MPKSKGAIDYRRYYINYLVREIEEKFKKIKEINDMPENLIEEQMYKDGIFFGFREEEK